MKTITISIGTFSVKLRSEGANAKGAEEIAVEIDWRTLREYWQTAKVYTVATVRDLLNRYDERLKQKAKEEAAQWPPHSIFCDKRCCQKPLASYMRFLKKNISWDSDGHIQ